MNPFVFRFQALVTGVLSGFDRLVFRGHLTPLRFDGGCSCSSSGLGSDCWTSRTTWSRPVRP